MYTFIESTLHEVIHHLHTITELDSDTVVLLYSFFQSTLLDALNLLDTHKVKRVECDNRQYYQLLNHRCLLLPRYCTCKEFTQSCLIQANQIMCSHLLAILLSDQLKLTEVEWVSNEKWAELFYVYHGNTHMSTQTK